MPVNPQIPLSKLPRGFAAMDPARLRAVSSKGGSAPHRPDKRGFAAMDESRRLEVSRKGLEARRNRPAEAGDAADDMAHMGDMGDMADVQGKALP